VTTTNPERLAEAEARSCTLKSNGYWGRTCQELLANGGSWYRVRRCARPECPHHVHTWARGDARYCSGTCRMAALRARRRGGEA
jgi:hypothetical protein